MVVGQIERAVKLVASLRRVSRQVRSTRAFVSSLAKHLSFL